MKVGGWMMKRVIRILWRGEVLYVAHGMGILKDQSTAIVLHDENMITDPLIPVAPRLFLVDIEIYTALEP